VTLCLFEYQDSKQSSFADTKPTVNVVEMHLDGTLGNIQSLSYLLIGEALGDQYHELTLS
jgi:hypothetical protein